MYEVEIKASIGDTSFRQLLNSAADLGFAYCMTVRETDVYYNGVDRDFMKTDEALRVRTCSRWQEGNPKDSESTLTNAPENSSQDISKESFITYKGPKLDVSSSTRIEHRSWSTIRMKPGHFSHPWVTSRFLPWIRLAVNSISRPDPDDHSPLPCVSTA